MLQCPKRIAKIFPRGLGGAVRPQQIEDALAALRRAGHGQVGQPLTLAPVIISSVIGAVAATGVFAAIGWFVRRPIRLFRIVAAITLILSFVSPFSLPGAPAGMILSLELMHIIAAAIIVWALATLGRNPR